MSPRSYFIRPGERSWHIHDGDDVTNWRALCGRLPTRFSDADEELREGARVCSLCRKVAARSDYDDALLVAETLFEDGREVTHPVPTAPTSSPDVA